MAKERINVTLPPGRLVTSNLYEPRTTDHKGQPRLYKTGDKAGQTRPDYGGLIAIPKTKPQWWDEVSPDPAVGAWGQAICAKAFADFPGGHAQQPAFSWKIIDGDSPIPNSMGNKPCDNPNWAKCWVVAFSSDRPPVIVNRDGSARLTEKDAVKTGYWVQASINVSGNDELMKPGIYINLNAIALNRIDEEIITGVNPTKLGFGGSVAPRGQDVPQNYGQAMPTSSAAVPATPGGAVPNATPATATVPATPAATGVPGVAAAPASATPNPGATVAAVPNNNFVAGAITPGGTPAVPVAAAVPVATPRYAKSATWPAGVDIQQFYDGGWTDEMMVQRGYLVPA